MQSFVKHPNFSFTQKYKCCISETESFSSANLTLGYVKKKKNPHCIPGLLFHATIDVYTCALKKYHKLSLQETAKVNSSVVIQYFGTIIYGINDLLV